MLQIEDRLTAREIAAVWPAAALLAPLPIPDFPPCGSRTPPDRQQQSSRRGVRAALRLFRRCRARWRLLRQAHTG